MPRTKKKRFVVFILLKDVLKIIRNRKDFLLMLVPESDRHKRVIHGCLDELDIVRDKVKLLAEKNANS